MKKLLYFCSVALLGCLAFTACGDDDPATPDVKPIDNTEDSDTTIVNDTTANDTTTTVSADSLITIVYSGSTATVTIPESIEGVSCSSGTSSDVVLTSTNTAQELYYQIQGSSTSGSLTIEGSYKMSLILNGINLTSTSGAAVNVQCGKRIALVLSDSTVNSFADAANGEQRACVYTKGHFEVSGGGTLNVTGNANHAIAAKEYLQLKRNTGTINIVKAANDAIHVGEFFQMNGGTVNIDQNTTSDGIQVEYKTDNGVVVADEENTGGVIIKGGTINITLNNSEDSKGIKAEGDIAISGGSFNINAESNGTRGIQTDGNMVIGQEDGTTNILIYAKGGKCTVAEDSEDPHKCMGIKVDGDLTVNAGTITVYNTGKKAKGIKVKGSYTKNGGTVNATVDKSSDE